MEGLIQTRFLHESKVRFFNQFDVPEIDTFVGGLPKKDILRRLRVRVCRWIEYFKALKIEPDKIL
jgi:hypothetical protein